MCQCHHVQDALTAVALFDREQGVLPSIADDLLAEANELARRSSVQMGGAGDIDLIYAAVILSGSTRAVETGVAYGWSSLAILAALENLGKGRLISVDMPYPKIGNEEFVGIVDRCPAITASCTCAVASALSRARFRRLHRGLAAASATIALSPRSARLRSA
jgi:hypothetical protein